MSSKYESMSDKEINIAIEKLEGIYSEDVEGKHMKTFDFNEWSDMGPLIDKANVSLLQQGDREGCCAFIWDKEEAECWHKNPLRAAAIVYLMVKEVK